MRERERDAEVNERDSGKSRLRHPEPCREI